MNETIKVRAADGLQVPLEGSPHEYINGRETVTYPIPPITAAVSNTATLWP